MERILPEQLATGSVNNKALRLDGSEPRCCSLCAKTPEQDALTTASSRSHPVMLDRKLQHLEPCNACETGNAAQCDISLVQTGDS